jgi:hypothetical protein
LDQVQFEFIRILGLGPKEHGINDPLPWVSTPGIEEYAVPPMAFSPFLQ